MLLSCDLRAALSLHFKWISVFLLLLFIYFRTGGAVVYFIYTCNNYFSQFLTMFFRRWITQFYDRISTLPTERAIVAALYLSPQNILKYSNHTYSSCWQNITIISNKLFEILCIKFTLTELRPFTLFIRTRPETHKSLNRSRKL